jgi:hypothetical protein
MNRRALLLFLLILEKLSHVTDVTQEWLRTRLEDAAQIPKPTEAEDTEQRATLPETPEPMVALPAKTEPKQLTTKEKPKMAKRTSISEDNLSSGLTEPTEGRAPKEPKEKLSPEERAQRVRDARQAKLDEFFAAGPYTYVDELHLDEGERYTDPTGNKGRHGHTLLNSEGTEVYVGPNTLKVGVENGTITGFVSKSERRKQERENSQTETLAEAQDDWEPTSEPEDEDLANRIEAEQEEGEYAEA